MAVYYVHLQKSLIPNGSLFSQFVFFTTQLNLKAVIGLAYVVGTCIPFFKGLTLYPV